MRILDAHAAENIHYSWLRAPMQLKKDITVWDRLLVLVGSRGTRSGQITLFGKYVPSTEEVLEIVGELGYHHILLRCTECEGEKRFLMRFEGGEETHDNKRVEVCGECLTSACAEMDVRSMLKGMVNR